MSQRLTCAEVEEDPTRARLLDEIVGARDSIYRFALFMTRDRHEAEDLTQDTLERAMSRLDTFDMARRQVGPWLFRIAKSLAIDQRRSAERRRRHDHGWYVSQPTHAPAPGEPGELPPALAAVVATLSREDRALLHLRVVVGLSPAETAHVLQITTTNCSTRLNRLMNKLRETSSTTSSSESVAARVDDLIDGRILPRTAAEREILIVAHALRAYAAPRRLSRSDSRHARALSVGVTP